MVDEMEMKAAMIDGIYDSLMFGEEPEISREEFHIEHEKYGLIVAVYNMGFLQGRDA